MSAPGKHEARDQPEKVGLPMTPFLYTLDQVAVMMQKPEDEFTSTTVYFNGRSTGRCHPRQLRAVNVQVDEEKTPDWRITEGELVRWLKLLGIRIYSRGRAV